eukprot:4983183-Amphidinium_carterae.2
MAQNFRALVPCLTLARVGSSRRLPQALAFKGSASPALALIEDRRPHVTSAVDPNAEMIEMHFKLRDGTRKTVSVPTLVLRRLTLSYVPSGSSSFKFSAFDAFCCEINSTQCSMSLPSNALDIM